ncbi:MAG: hypothetical protein MR210_04605 [Erysipelotrichaceae bacterium]|nr:hypothetical protein [Erysipelotrichaceae bacterium]MDY5252512.1 hypothetical protein [Erysipelotrichaceae bacterium]
MAKKEIVAGRNIYILDDGQKVLYDRFSKGAYIIKERHVNQLSYYTNRYIIALVLGILIATFKVNIIICIVAGVLALAISEFKYRKFLDTLTQVPNFDIKKYHNVSRIDGIVQEGKKGRAALLAFLYLALAVLIVLNGILQNHAMYMLIIEGIIAIVGLYFAITNIIAITKMK